jgi:hypothetical protein
MFKKVGDLLGNQPEKVETNPFADILEEPLKQHPALAANVAPKQKIEEKIPTREEWLAKAPVNNPSLPPRPGPTIWWQKDQNHLSPVTAWHRAHRMSPAYQVPGEEIKRGVAPVREKKSTKAWYDEE